MFDFLGRLFGTGKALESVVDHAASGLDKLYYSDEEKAEDAAKSRSEARQMVVEWMQSTQGQNIARRLIALVVTTVWMGMYLLSVATDMIAVFMTEQADKLSDLGEIAYTSANDMNPAAMLILAFYFAAPHMGDIASAAINKMRNRTG